MATGLWVIVIGGSALAPLPPAPYRAAFHRAQTLVALRRGGPARGRTSTLPQPAGR